MAKDNDINPAVVITCLAIPGITIRTEVTIESFIFFTSLKDYKHKADNLLHRHSRSLRPKIGAT